MLHWDGLCHQYSITSKNFCSTVFSTRYLQREKKFSKDFWQVDDRILSWGERSLKKSLKIRTGLFWVMAAILRCCYRWWQPRTYFNNSLPPQTVLNSSLPWASTLDFLKMLMTKAREVTWPVPSGSIHALNAVLPPLSLWNIKSRVTTM